jgi:Carboxypeptidase regulatory-like domain/TonB dependent receptor-like, beta-barrel
MKARVISVVLLFLSIALLASQALAQATVSFAQLNGTVQDSTGHIIPKAAVTLRSLDTNQTYRSTANDAGFYVVPNLPPGRYEQTVEYSGLGKYTNSGLVLSVGQTATVNISLRVATVHEMVEVTTEVPPVEPTRTELSQVIDTKQIESLPISGRLFTDFALLTPGVATGRTSLQSTITEFEVTRVSFGGMRDLSNIVTVDGADTINTVTGSQRATPPQEAVSEFRVVNNGFGAEYGRALGGIVNIVTKSGTNTLHGSVYDYFQNSKLDSRSLLQPAPQPFGLRQNQFGGTLGGPIVKDRTFFFMNYEGQRRGETPTFPSFLIDNLALVNAAKARLGISPENLNILKTKDNDYGIIKVDHQLNTANRLSLRYNIEDGRDLNLLVGNTLDGGGIGAPSSGHDAFIRDQSLAGTVASVIKSNLVNTALVQYGRRHYDFPGVTGQPNLDIPNLFMTGHNFGVLDAIFESRLQVADSLSWVKGTHAMKFGFDTNYLKDFVIWPGFTPMRIVLPGVNCLVQFTNFVNPNPTPLAENPLAGPCPLPPFLNGTPIVFWGSPIGSGPSSSIQGTSPAPIPTNWQNAYLPSETGNFSETLNHGYWGFFAQDQWRVTQKLTLNYGLRYDFETGLDKQVFPTRHNGFQPRVGFAYSPDNKTVIRSGFGIFADRYNLSFFFITQPQRPVTIPGVELPGVRKGAETATWALSQYVATPFAMAPNGQPWASIIGGFGLPADAAKNLILTGQVPPTFLTGPPGTLVPVGLGGVDHNSKIPYSEQSNLEIDREIGKGFTVSAGYMFVAAHHLVRAENLNVCPTSGVSSAVTFCPPAGPVPPGWPAGKNYFSPVPIPGAVGNPLYTNAGLLYFTDNTGSSVYHGLTLQAAKNAGRYLRFNANYTFSHTLDDGTFTTFVSTPQDLYRRSLERANSNQDARHRFVANFVADGPQGTFLRNFSLSNIVTIQSPRPFTMFVGFDANGDTNPVTDRVGLQGRNTYWGDNLRSWDVRLSRAFPIKENLKVDLMVDVFNVLNRQNVDEVNSVYGTYDFCGGQVPQRYGDSITKGIQAATAANCPAGGPPIASPGFGLPRTTLNPRQFQLAVKFSF